MNQVVVVTCNHCQRDNEYPSDEVCPGYTDLYEACKLFLELHSAFNNLLSLRATDDEVISMLDGEMDATGYKVWKALAKTEVHTCYYCGHEGTDVSRYALHHVGGEGEVAERCCDDGELCAQRVEAQKVTQ